MENIKKTRELISLDDPRVKQMEEYDAARLSDAIQLNKTVNLFYPAKVMVETYKGEHDKKDWFHAVYVIVASQIGHITINFNSYTKKYNLWAWELNQMEHISNDRAREIKNKFEAPNLIGVLTEKKIKDWVKYYEQVLTAVDAKATENREAKEEFLDKVKDNPHLKWNPAKTKGTIINGGLEYTFDIGEDYIYEKLGIHYSTPSTYASFVHMANNQCTPPIIKSNVQE
jgi:hypothetical protein